MQELKVQTKQANIETNFTEVRENLKFSLEKYKGLLVSEETLKDCKATQKELAGLRNKVDGYRKETKSKLQEPIKKFEEECKELLSLIVEVEKPIKEGIAKFDEERRQEKVLSALDYLRAKMEENELNEKYRLRISIHDIKINLTNSMKSIKEEIDVKVSNLKALQEAELREKALTKNTITQYIEAVNEDINTKLTYSEFSKFVEDGWTVDKIMSLINGQVKKIKEAEKQKEVTPVETIEQKPVEPVKAKEPVTQEKFFVELKIVGDKYQMGELKNFLMTRNFQHELLKQGRI